MMHRATLDLADDELHALLTGAIALAKRELRATRDGPIYAQPPSAQRLDELLDPELPVEGETLQELLGDTDAVLAAGRRTAPGFFGYILSPPAPVAVAGDLLASAAGQNVTAWRSAPAATHVERIVVRWLGELTAFSEEAAGLLVSGGSMANLTALLIALRTRTEPDADRRTLVAYASDEVHFSVAKAAAVIGVRLRSVATDEAARIDLDALRTAIGGDRSDGLEPFCVIASAGTTATGAIDDLGGLAALAEQHGLWLHVDGAYGALAAASPAHRPLFAGIERADSLSVDAHKWLSMPIDCSALLVRDAAASASAFGSHGADYVRLFSQEETESFAFWDHGIELTRRFRALKLWMTLRYHGARHVGAAIAEDIALAEHMAQLVRDTPELELLAEPGLSICCFRHTPPGVAAEALDEHNERLLLALQRDGRVYLSNASIGGRFALRACIVNFRTTRADVERAIELVCELGR